MTLDDELRDLLSEEAAGVPTDVDLLGGVARLRGRRRRHRVRRAVAVTGTLVVVGAVVATAVLVPAHGRGGDRTDQATVPGGYAAGTRPVTWAGIQLDVPASWSSGPSDPHRCAPLEETPGGQVDYAGKNGTTTNLCGPGDHPVRERLELGTAYSLDPRTAVVSDATFAGMPAVQRQATVLGQLVTEYEVTATHAVYTVTTNTAAETATIVATAHPVTADEHGCATTGPETLLTGLSTVDPVGPVLSTVPVGGTICSYESGHLASSLALDPATTAALAGALGRLPAVVPSAPPTTSEASTEPEVVTELDLRDAAGDLRQVSVAYGQQVVGVLGAHLSGLTQELADDLDLILPSTFVDGIDGTLVTPGCVSCTPPAAPPPTRPVRLRGVTVDVPGTWDSADSVGCGPFDGVAYTVTHADTGVYNCPASTEPRAVTAVLLTDPRFAYGDPPASPPASDGALPTAVVADDGEALAVVRLADVTVEAVAPTAASARALLATVRAD